MYASTPARLALPPSLSRSLNSQPVCVVAQRTRHVPRTLLLGWMPAPPDSPAYPQSQSSMASQQHWSASVERRRSRPPQSWSILHGRDQLTPILTSGSSVRSRDSRREHAPRVGRPRQGSFGAWRGRGLTSASTEDPEPNETVETRMILDWSGPLHLGTASRLDAPSHGAWVTG
eukprot:COSAG03_NODE_240_length_10098_cov_71.012101_4_plen_174_part_00